MIERNVEIKLRVICALLTLCFILSIIGMFSRAGIMPVNEDAILSKEYIDNLSIDTDFYSICSGDIVDCNGNPIQENTTAGENGEVNESYGLLVGYFDPNYGSYGLRGRYKDYLQTEYKKTGKGLSLKLTTCNELQELIYKQFKGRDASVVVMERNSGKILALVSTDSTEDFNPANIYDSNAMDRYNSIPEFWYPKYILDQPAGSVMKIYTTAAMLESGFNDFTYIDDGFIKFNNGEITNYNGVAYGTVNLNEAFTLSINTYFAEAARKLGYYRMNCLSDKILFNQDIYCDFGTVSSHYSLGNTTYDIASAGYGQGQTLNSTISLALMLQGICEQTIYQPRITDCFFSRTKDGIQTISETNDTILSKKVVSKSTADAIDELMLTASNSYGLPAELGIRSKTGTAEIDSSNIGRATFVSYNDKYIVVISEHNTNKFGISLADEAVEVYEFLASFTTN